MFEELKKCKTLKEIYTLLGTDLFEKAALILVLAWCLLPIWSVGEHIYWGIVGVNDMQITYAITYGYQLVMQFVGSLSLYLAIFFLIGRVSVYGKGVIRKLKAEPWHLFLLVMLLWSCISTLLSDDVAQSFHGTEYRFDGLKSYFFYAGAYVCAFLMANSKRRKIVFNVFTVVANIVSIIIVLQDRGVPLFSVGFLDVLSGPFFQLNHAGCYLCMAIICSMGLYLYEERRGLRLLYLASMIIQVYGILVNSTFGSFLASWFALIMILIFFVRKQGHFAWRMITPVLVVIVLCIFSYMGYIPTSCGQDMRYNIEDIKNSIQGLKEDAEAVTSIETPHAGVGHGRVALWKQGLKMIPRRPIFGYGPEQLDEELSEGMWIDRVDNEFIQHAVFLGIPGLIYYLTALIWLFLHQWKGMKQLDYTVLIAAGCVIAYLASSMFGNTMFYTTPYLYMFLAFASGRVEHSS